MPKPRLCLSRLLTQLLTDRPPASSLPFGLVYDPLDQLEPLATERHVLAELPPAAEIVSVRVAPPFKGAITLAFVIGQGGIHFAKAAVGEFNSLEHRARAARAVEHDHTLAERRQLALAYGPAGRSLLAVEDERGEFVGQFGGIPERKGLKLAPVHRSLHREAGRDGTVTPLR
jgi:hypothetical protein